MKRILENIVTHWHHLEPLIEQRFGANWRSNISGSVALVAAAIVTCPELIAFVPEPPRETIFGLAKLIAFVSGGAFVKVVKDAKVTGGTVKQDGAVFPRHAGEPDDRIPHL